jgi:hypothetical protein
VASTCLENFYLVSKDFQKEHRLTTDSSVRAVQIVGVMLVKALYNHMLACVIKDCVIHYSLCSVSKRPYNLRERKL